jgi:hypothetical protein
MDPGFRRRWLGMLLPGAFAAFWLLNLAVGFESRTVGLDARIYYQGSATWLAGQNPWSAGAYLGDELYSYAGLPRRRSSWHTARAPAEAFVWLWLALSAGAAIVIVRSSSSRCLADVPAPPLRRPGGEPARRRHRALVAGERWAGWSQGC